MEILQELLEDACPSIRYRIRSEILGESIDTAVMAKLQKEILADEWVRKVFSWQQPDGWIGRDFHGENSLETGIRVLCEKGIEKTHPILKKALEVLSIDDKRLTRGIGKAGISLDKKNLGGTQLIRAVVFSYAGVEDIPIMQEQVQKALTSFQTPAITRAIEEITTIHKGKLVYRPAIVWPSIYHLRLLAFTHTWRTKENYKILADGIQQLVKLSPMPYILLKYKSQLVAPASFCMLDFNPDIHKLDDVGWMMWFHRMELLARLGIIHMVSALVDQVNELNKLLISDQGWFSKRLSHKYFGKWGAYSGLMLEKDWKNPNRRIFDLTFRSLLIKYYFECQNG
ncbi:MAG: hypothetical protein CVU41_14165 [Chloroflexi bacterium HGW-Chloroflexi-3]|nr:MAG: hypothetical protein CVU41_14165 [Chloroflexi bacterium HGW-Chloroflexi-3]